MEAVAIFDPSGAPQERLCRSCNAVLVQALAGAYTHNLPSCRRWSLSLIRRWNLRVVGLLPVLRQWVRTMQSRPHNRRGFCSSLEVCGELLFRSQSSKRVCAWKALVGLRFQFQFSPHRKLPEFAHEGNKLLDEHLFVVRRVELVRLESGLAQSVAPTHPEFPFPIRHLDAGFLKESRYTKRHPAVHLGVRLMPFRIRCFSESAGIKLNPDPLCFPHIYIIVGHIRVPGHALRDLDTAAIREIIRNPRGAEGVAAYRRLNVGVRSTPADHCIKPNRAGRSELRYEVLTSRAAYCRLKPTAAR